jgi:oligosaccharide repeat unit polymerase
LRDLLQAATWLNMAVTYSLERYSGITSETLTIRLLLALNYAAAILGGVVIAAYKQRVLKALGFAPLLPALAIAIITTAKAPLLVCAIMLVSAYIVTARRAERPTVASSGWRRWLAAALLVGGLLSASLFSLALRYGDATQADPDLVANQFSSYVFGYMAAWSAWATPENLFASPTTNGQLTFAGAFEALGLAARNPGLFSAIATNKVSAESNVFTAFRGLIEDISFPGALVAALAFAVMAGWCFVRLSRGTRFTWPAIYLIAYFNFIGWSPVVSIFIYNSVVFAFILAGILMYILNGEIEHRLQRAAVDGT